MIRKTTFVFITAILILALSCRQGAASFGDRYIGYGRGLDLYQPQLMILYTPVYAHASEESQSSLAGAGLLNKTIGELETKIVLDMPPFISDPPGTVSSFIKGSSIDPSTGEPSNRDDITIAVVFFCKVEEVIFADRQSRDLLFDGDSIDVINANIRSGNREYTFFTHEQTREIIKDQPEWSMFDYDIYPEALNVGCFDVAQYRNWYYSGYQLYRFKGPFLPPRSESCFAHMPGPENEYFLKLPQYERDAINRHQRQKFINTYECLKAYIEVEKIRCQVDKVEAVKQYMDDDNLILKFFAYYTIRKSGIPLNPYKDLEPIEFLPEEEQKEWLEKRETRLIRLFRHTSGNRSSDYQVNPNIANPPGIYEPEPGCPYYSPPPHLFSVGEMSWHISPEERKEFNENYRRIFQTKKTYPHYAPPGFFKMISDTMKSE